MSPKEICTKLSLWIVNFYLKSYIFCFHFTLYLHVWIRIRIQKAPEYGSNTDQDPDPQHWLLLVDPNILNLDLDPEWWPNLDPGPKGKKMLKIVRGKKMFI